VNSPSHRIFSTIWLSGGEILEGKEEDSIMLFLGIILGRLANIKELARLLPQE
jgi:hypothetical protein